VAGLASPHSARELWRVTKNKLKDEFEEICSGLQKGRAGGGGGSSPKKKAATPRKKAAAVGADGTPTPTPKKRKASAKVVDGDEAGDDVENGGGKKRKTAADGASEAGDGAKESPVKYEVEDRAVEFSFF
jgi:hypothetical protein